jgi:hypothetical protein
VPASPVLDGGGQPRAAGAAAVHLQAVRFHRARRRYWGIVATVLGARYLDIVRYQGLTADGEPASMRDFRRHAVRLTIVAAGLWIATHLLRGVL